MQWILIEGKKHTTKITRKIGTFTHKHTIAEVRNTLHGVRGRTNVKQKKIDSTRNAMRNHETEEETNNTTNSTQTKIKNQR